MTLLASPRQNSSAPTPPDEMPASPDISTMPRLTTTVPREYVHRSSLAEVFLSGCERLDETHFSLTGQWPRAHTFFTSADGARHDPMQAVETIRQVGLYLAHAEFGVPLGHQFLMWDMTVTTNSEHLFIGPVPSELSLIASCTDMKWKGKRLAEFTMHITVERDGVRCAAGGGRFSCIAPAAYRRLRGAAAGARCARRLHPVGADAPTALGRILPFDVVLAPGDRPGRWLLDPDPRHPILFDHNADHIPGMVLLEAARQAACSLARPDTLTPSYLHAEFLRYAEFDSPCWVEASWVPSAEGTADVLVTGTQDGNCVFTAQVCGSLGEPAAPPLLR
ncbi:ScbA/BarX family gamma-butyrolactone biosynthesis protein [Streptomyces sp. NBC_01465]|uniref:ScbA/BarX family gamma-butyrolactone biosynthesis protein n=1 Tax=Streptomyces sp. NBC_01465 TaxID=2903878 RepID=UPI002E325ECE|nr:ScbA/BarX family gamma-butyrolactone biosynthesis protein [Streptomyces sp. NBC_01465]